MIFLKTPKFWQRKPNLFLRYFLKPISLIYSFFAEKNYFKPYEYKSEKSEVIAVGAVTVGGSGKTIVVKSLCEILKKHGKKIAILSRGYGRSSDSCTKVNYSSHTYKEVGDEPLLLSKSAPVFVSKNRAQSAKCAEDENYNCLILDDGLMQRYLQPSKKFIVIDNSQKFGNGEILPLGPNRLNTKTILADADAIFVLGNDSSKDVSWIDAPANTPIIFGKLQSDFSLIKKDVIAFCGIGYPEKFFNSLKGFKVIKKISFPDHSPFSDEVLKRLIESSKLFNAQLVTTEKDFMRIPEKYRAFVSFIPVTIKWENENLLNSLL